jgi:hypothetical protein
MVAVIAALFIPSAGWAIAFGVFAALYGGSFAVPWAYRRALPHRRRLTLPHPIRRYKADTDALRLAVELEAMADKITVLVDESGSANISGEALSLFDRACDRGVVARSERAKIENPLSLELLAGMFRGLATKARQSVPEKRRNPR